MTSPLSPRRTDHPIEPLFLKRWSPRAYDASPMPEADLLSILEAARWAPSAYNVQPWRFLYARRGDAHWDTFVGVLNDFNRPWAEQASALVAVVSNTVMVNDQDGTTSPMPSHSFDTGAAWAHLALQATAQGYQAHAMAGIDFDLARDVFKVPDSYAVEIVVAVGTPASPDILPDLLREREQPSGRLALDVIAYPGAFPA